MIIIMVIMVLMVKVIIRVIVTMVRVNMDGDESINNHDSDYYGLK